MDKELFIVDTITIEENIHLNLLLEKDMNLRELCECYIQIFIDLEKGKNYKKTKKIRFVTKDKIITLDKLMHEILILLQDTSKVIEALNSGINLTQEFYLETPGIDNSSIEIRKDLQKSIGNINEYKLQPYIIKLYTILTSYKGTDTLQQRKYQKMIEDQEYMIHNRNRGTI